MNAQDAITDAYERINRLSPGESLSGDDLAFGFRRLNLLVDEMAGQMGFNFLSTQTSAAQTGAITLGSGSWAAVNPGDEIISMTANNLAMAPISMRQFNELYQPAVTGLPTVWAFDGLYTVNLWPVPNGQTIKILTRSTIAAFADYTTDYVVPHGFETAIGAALAVRIAPTLLGKLPPELLRAEQIAMGSINRYEPAVLNVNSYIRPHHYYPPRLF